MRQEQRRQSIRRGETSFHSFTALDINTWYTARTGKIKLSFQDLPLRLGLHFISCYRYAREGSDLNHRVSRHIRDMRELLCIGRMNPVLPL